MIQDNLKEIIEFVTGPQFTDEIYLAKEEYKHIFGEIYEDDPSYESRVDQFLEWYTFDRIIRGKTFTPLVSYLEANRENWTPEILESRINLTDNIHGIFVVKKVWKDHLIILNLFDKIKYKAIHEQCELVFKKNDLFEGRLIHDNQIFRFTGSFCFHPQETFKFIKKEIEHLNDEVEHLETELKKLQGSKKKLVKESDKWGSKVKVWDLKIEAADSFNKPDYAKNKEILESKKKIVDDKIDILNEQIYNKFSFRTQKESLQAKAHLIQRLSYMNLRWERSRQIDLKDIYKN